MTSLFFLNPLYPPPRLKSKRPGFYSGPFAFLGRNYLLSLKAGSSSRSAALYSLNFETTSVALCPPKPKELLSATSIFASRAVFGT